MNRTYRLVWNRASNALQVASELAGGHGGRSFANGASLRAARKTLALAVFTGLGMAAFALPASALCTRGDPNCLQVPPPTPGQGSGAGGSLANGGQGANGANGSGDGPGMDLGGAGGGLGRLVTISGTGGGSITGGAGGMGAAAVATTSTAGGGGGGGAGALIKGAVDFTNQGDIVGGMGGTGGQGAGGGFCITGCYNGGGGGGGAGVLLTNGGGSTGPTFTNSAGSTVAGGAGGIGGDCCDPKSDGKDGNGGAGLVADGGATVTNAGMIEGRPRTSQGSPEPIGGYIMYTDAVDFTGGGNKLVLEKGFTFAGDVNSAGGDTLALGGNANASFDLSGVFARWSNSDTNVTQYDGFSNFEKTGSSTWTVTGGNAAPGNNPATGVFSGAISVDGGTLRLADAVLGGSAATVAPDATLDGTGTLNAPTTIDAGGTLSPGTTGGVGTLTIGGALDMLGNLDIGIDGTGNFDWLDVAGDATFGTTSFFNFALDNDSNQQAGDTFEFFDANSFLNFADAGSNFSCSGLLSGLTCALSQTDGGLFLTLDGSSGGGGTGPASVPEPGSLGMLGLGLVLLGGGVGWRKWRDRKEA